MKLQTIKYKLQKLGSSKNSDDYKKCPFCLQNEIPFKKGVCICGKQVGSVQYVKNPYTFAKNNYSYNVIQNKQNTTIVGWKYKYDRQS